LHFLRSAAVDLSASSERDVVSAACVITRIKIIQKSQVPNFCVCCAKIRQRRGARVIHMCVCLNCPLPVHVNKYAPRAAPLCRMRKTVSLLYYINVVLAVTARAYAVCAFLPVSRPSQCATGGKKLRICMSWLAVQCANFVAHSCTAQKKIVRQCERKETQCSRFTL
jgi:hypothetical protein